MLSQRQSSRLARRDDSHSGTTNALTFILVALAILITVPTITYFILKRIRRYHYEPKLVPGSYLKRKWQEWAPRGRYSRVAEYRRNRRNAGSTEYAPSTREAEEATSVNAAAAGVDRNTSVRSVMTLPAYSSVAKPTERILGREGERAGMDVVAEWPENADEQEAARDAEMESLYQIRLARRQEIADREARRQARREARERGDSEALERLRRESLARRDEPSMNDSTTNLANLSAAAMLAEHQARDRGRRASAVTYASLGLVRHDGTRIRSESADSQREGLLDDAASMGGGRPSMGVDRPSTGGGRPSTHGRTISLGSTLSALAPGHFRNRSASSALSVSTTANDEEREGATTPYTQAPSSLGRGRRRSGDAMSTRSSDERPNRMGSSISPAATRLTPESDGDIADSSIPALTNNTDPEPPDYDNLDWGDAPPYSSPVRGPGEAPHAQSLDRQLAERSLHGNRNSNGSTISRSQGVNRIPTLPPQLPAFRTLPVINVESATEPLTPIGRE